MSESELWPAVTDSDTESDSSISGTATYIKYCFFTGHIICAYVCSIYHSSLLRYCLLCAPFQPLVVSKLSRWTFARHPVDRAQHASLASGAAKCDIATAIYRISWSFAGNELGNAPTAWKQLRWRRRLDLICTSGQRRTNTLVARTYARWPLRASAVLDQLARRVKKASGQCRGLTVPALSRDASSDRTQKEAGHFLYP